MAQVFRNMFGRLAQRMMARVMGGNVMAMRLQRHKGFFHRTVSCFEEKDATFRPRDNMLSVAGQIMHVTAAIELTLSGLIHNIERFKDMKPVSRRGPTATWIALDYGFTSLNWANESNKEIPEFVERPTLAASLRAFDETIDMATEMFGGLTPQELMQPLPKTPMPMQNPIQILEMLIDHTAHHRGALAQYARLLGYEPKFPYFDLAERAHEASLA